MTMLLFLFTLILITNSTKTMRKISTLASLLVLAISMTIASCSNEEGMETPNMTNTQQITRSQIVDILKGMNYDNQTICESNME